MKRQILFFTAILCCAFGFAKEPQQPDSYNYKRGCELIGEQKYDEGIEFLGRELRQNPKNGYAMAWMASAYRHKDEKGTSIELAHDALKNLPKAEKYYAAWTHNLLAGIYWEMNDTVMAFKEVSLAIQTEPKNEDWYENRGLLYRQCKQWEKSNADFRKYIELKPGLIRGYMLLGYNYQLNDNYVEALKQYTKADLLASRSFTLGSMAEMEVKLGKYEDAAKHAVEAFKMEHFEESASQVLKACNNEELAELVQAQLRVQVAKNPNAPEWQLYQVMVYRARHEFEKAIRAGQKVQKIYPDLDGFFSDMYADMGDFAHALAYINKAIDADSTDVSLRYDRANIYSEMDSIDAMMVDLAFNIEQQPEESNWYFARASKCLFLSRYKEAIEDYNTGLAIVSSNDWERYMRGRCYEAIGDTAKAHSDYRRALSQSSRPEVRLFALASLAQKEEAMHLADSLLKADTTEYRYNVACAYALMGEKELALHYIDEEMRDGYVHFRHLRLDPDLQSLQGDELEQLIQKYEAIRDERVARFQEEQGEEAGEEKVVEVPFTAANGVTKVDCTINGLPLNFVFDTGASDVTISQTEANFMYKNGYLNQKDVIGKQRYQTADGNISVGTTFMINHINFGGLELTGVRASVVANQKAPLLLGQTVLQRLGKIEIDNEKKVLKITTKK